MTRLRNVLLLVLVLPVLAVLAVLSGCSSSQIGMGAGLSLGGRPSDAYQGYPPPMNPPAAAMMAPNRLGTSNSFADAGPRIGEELWIIRRPEGERSVDASRDDQPGCGAMLTRLSGAQSQVALPLKHTDVHASIAGYIATVDVSQQFHNPYGEKIEAVYVFPLPADAAVSEFVMTIGPRHIRGLIRERKVAEQIYRQAKAQGYIASLLTQERPNIFTQSVANIEPGREIDVNIRYFHTLRLADGWCEFVFPMVVGPRYNPAYMSDGVGAVGRHAAGRSGQSTEVSYLRPSERSGHDISLSVDIDAGMEIEEVACSSHRVTTSQRSTHTASILLSPSDSMPNKDLVLRYRLAGDRLKTALIRQDDDRGGFFTLMLVPPRGLAHLPRQPMEMIFLLDCSGSMSGKPLAQVKAATVRALECLDDNDTFRVICFNNSAWSFNDSALAATGRNTRRAIEFVNRLQADGGTEMLTGVRAVLAARHDARHQRLVALMTDGFIGNETEILQEVARRSSDTRFFGFGVGSSPNRYLIEGLAAMGGGAVAYVGLNDSPEKMVEQYLQTVSHPALTNVKVDWGDLEVSDVYPRRIPDMYVGRPVVVSGRCTGNTRGSIRITGQTAGGESVEMRSAVSVQPATAFRQSGMSDWDDDEPAIRRDSRPAAGALAAVWARMKIADLTTQAALRGDDGGETADRIKRVALDYGLMSAYTAFVAVDAAQRTSGDHGTTVRQAVPVPEGTRYDTTVEDR